jgi:hypothetical protein
MPDAASLNPSPPCNVDRGSGRHPNFGDVRLPERFWNLTQPCPMSGCWLFVSERRTGYGYGSIRFRGVTVTAHRLSYELLIGPIPIGLQIDHLCRVQCCVNPAHLEPVTSRENTLRSTGLAAQEIQRNACRQGHEYTAENTYMNNGSRVCRECTRTNLRRRRSASTKAVQP